MTEMQKKMRELISKEALDRAFDARFPKEMQSQGLAVLARTLRSCLPEAESGNCFWWILMWLV